MVNDSYFRQISLMSLVISLFLTYLKIFLNDILYIPTHLTNTNAVWVELNFIKSLLKNFAKIEHTNFPLF